MAMPPINGYYLTFALLIACTIIGIGVAARFRREVDEDLAPMTSHDLLDPLEKAYFSGLMRPEEIERIRESVKRSQDAEIASPGAAKKTRTTTRPFVGPENVNATGTDAADLDSAENQETESEPTDPA